MIVAQRVVKRVIYIPVADATAGWISIDTSTGLKIVPGPIPDRDAKKAPRNAKIDNLIEFLTVSF